MLFICHKKTDLPFEMAIGLTGNGASYMIDWKWSILCPFKTIEIPYFENHVVLSFQRWLKVNFALQK